jgi:hypothetical protein
MDWRSLPRRALALLFAKSAAPPTVFLTRWLFLRLLGLIYFIAFLSLWVQLDGLYGSNGILPIAGYVAAAKQQLGPGGFWQLPSLCWISASDGFLHFLSASGVVLSLVVIAGSATGPALLLLWAIYLSFQSVGQEFLGFQWDILLTEVGFLAVLFAPWRLLPAWSKEAPPSRIALWLLRFLLFRFMFASGVVKLTSGDPTWRNLTALTFHYETQCLPPWTAWFVHQLPASFQKLSCLAMFGLELAVPFLIFTPRPFRLIAFVLLASFQVLIIVTGNYCFFNLLTLALCLTLVDDTAWRHLCPGKWGSKILLPPQTTVAPKWRRFVIGMIGAPIAVASLVMLLLSLQVPFGKLPGWLQRWVQVTLRWRTVSTYGLFAVMTTSRPEIIVEGSNDGMTWLAYEFKWKPGDLKRRPAFVAPHQPRLDWQMWFAALGNVQGNRWFVQFLVRLLEGKPEVLALLEKNPFPDKPPRYVRAVLYDYHFTDAKTRRETGQWWRREPKGLYCPPVSLRQN